MSLISDPRVLGAGLVGGSFAAGSVLIGAERVDSGLLYKALISGGSEYAAAMLVPMIASYVPAEAQMFARPLISGAVYVGLQMYVAKMDGNSATTMFLYQAGASVVGGKLVRPVQDLLM